jgi:inner membrane protein
MVSTSPVKATFSALLKLAAIGALALGLLIPLAMVGHLVAERQERHDAVAREIAATWGAPQTVAGPVLSVPYRVHAKNERGQDVTATSVARFLPAALAVDGKVAPERRRRGIYEVAVYRAELHLSGSFERPDFAPWHVAPEDVLWDQAYLAVGVPDMRGIRGAVDLAWAGRPVPLAPGGGQPGLWSSGLQAAVPGLAAEKENERYDFAFDLGLDGTGGLRFLPFGRETRVALRSTWPDPSFTGAFLPKTRRVGASGFAAAWEVSYFGRSYPQQWRVEEAEQLAPPAALDASAFGVELFLPVDVYQKTERSVKYGVLFLLLTFLTFFLYEAFGRFALHPVQYLLVGAALCLFYLLLLSISEHVAFGLSYAIAAAATIALIGGYSASILAGRGRALLLSGVLAVLYGYLYVLLQAEDYALLLGAVGLFVILAVVMFLTRRIDWYGARVGPSRDVAPGAG